MTIDTTNYNALTGALLTRGAIGTAGQSLASGASTQQDVGVSGSDELTVEVDMNGAATGDLTVSVYPYESDGTTLMPITVPIIGSTGPTFVTSRVYFIGHYDVSATERVRITITNNNAGAQTLNRASWRCIGG
jgi:hypothetical protein